MSALLWVLFAPALAAIGDYLMNRRLRRPQLLASHTGRHTSRNLKARQAEAPTEVAA